MNNLGIYGRLLSRTIVNGLYNNCSVSSSSSKNNVVAASNEAAGKFSPHLVSAVAGFPKDKSGKVRKGQIGDDAWLITHLKTADILGNFCVKFILCVNNLILPFFQVLLMVLEDGGHMELILVIFPIRY